MSHQYIPATVVVPNVTIVTHSIGWRLLQWTLSNGRFMSAQTKDERIEGVENTGRVRDSSDNDCSSAQHSIKTISGPMS
jgi:hypothetical protein